jgi:hypothetical protein
MDERYPYSKATGEINAFEGNTPFAVTFDPPLQFVLEDIWGRYELSCMIPPELTFGGITVSPLTVDDITSLVSEKPHLVTDLVRILHRSILGLSGMVYDSNWSEYDVGKLIELGVSEEAEFPKDYTSLPKILSTIAFSKKVSKKVDCRFKIAGPMKAGDEYASWAVNRGTPNKPYLYHRLSEIVSDVGGDIKLAVGNSSNPLLNNRVTASAPQSWSGVVQRNSPIRTYWIGCSPVKILNMEQGSGYGSRRITFNLVKDSDFGYFVSRTPTGRDVQTYASTSSSDRETLLIEENNTSVTGAVGNLILDEPNRIIQTPTSPAKYVENEKSVTRQHGVQREYVFPDTGEVPYRRSFHTSFTLNGEQLPILDRITDITSILRRGVNTLIVEYFGEYAWSDWWILPAIRVVDRFDLRPRGYSSSFSMDSLSSIESISSGSMLSSASSLSSLDSISSLDSMSSMDSFSSMDSISTDSSMDTISSEASIDSMPSDASMDEPSSNDGPVSSVEP